MPGFEATAKDAFLAKIGSVNIYQWQYVLTDHLGNQHALFANRNGDGLLQQSTDENSNEVLALRNYSAFGLELGGSHQNINYQNTYKYTGKEENSFTGYYDFGARWSDPIIGNRFLHIDPLAEITPHLSLYQYGYNNPINMVDIDGRYAVSVHYDITYYALISRGYSDKQADRIAHMASTYADHPAEGVRMAGHFGHNLGSRGHLAYRQGIDYSLTRDSQEEYNSHWHSMMSNAEASANKSKKEAMMRGLKFGWDNIFSQVEKEDLGKLGQGLHALQDAYAHEGMSTAEHLDFKSIYAWKQTFVKDMYGDTKDASQITKSAIVVWDLIKGKKVNLKDGDTLNFTGMSSEQFQRVTQMLINQGFQGTIINGN